jgi:hypothetical protein
MQKIDKWGLCPSIDGLFFPLPVLFCKRDQKLQSTSSTILWVGTLLSCDTVNILGNSTRVGHMQARAWIDMMTDLMTWILNFV